MPIKYTREFKKQYAKASEKIKRAFKKRRKRVPPAKKALPPLLKRKDQRHYLVPSYNSDVA